MLNFTQQYIYRDVLICQAAITLPHENEYDDQEIKC